MLGDVFGRQPDRAARRVGAGDPRRRAGRRRARRWPAARRHRRSRAQRRRAGPDGRRPTTGRSCTSGRRHRAVLPRRPGVRARVRAVRRAGRRAGHGHADPPVQPALLRARRRVPAARDAEPRHLQPPVRDDLDRQRAGVLRDPRERPARDRGQRVAATAPARRSCTRRCSCRSRSRGSCPPAALLVDPPELRYAARRGDRVRAGVLREPRLHATRSATRTRPTWRSRRTSSARWSAARSSTSRCSPASGSLLVVVAVLYTVAFLLAGRYRFLADAGSSGRSRRASR